MPDITLCSPERIKTICRSCYRRNAKPSEWQSYSRFTPSKDGKKCDHYIKGVITARGIRMEGLYDKGRAVVEQNGNTA